MPLFPTCVKLHRRCRDLLGSRRSRSRCRRARPAIDQANLGSCVRQISSFVRGMPPLRYLACQQVANGRPRLNNLEWTLTQATKLDQLSLGLSGGHFEIRDENALCAVRTRQRERAAARTAELNGCLGSHCEAAAVARQRSGTVAAAPLAWQMAASRRRGPGEGGPKVISRRGKNKYINKRMNKNPRT